MNIKFRFTYPVVLIIILATMATACGRTSSIPPDYQPDTSKASDLCRLQFIHPKEWEVKDDTSAESVFLIFYSSTTESASQALKVWKYMLVSCYESIHPSEDVEFFVSLVLASQKYSNVTVIRDQVFDVNGFKGRLVERRILPTDSTIDETVLSPKIPIRVIDVNVAKDKWFYSFILYVPEDQADDKFRQQFETLVESIKFVP